MWLRSQFHSPKPAGKLGSQDYGGRNGSVLTLATCRMMSTSTNTPSADADQGSVEVEVTNGEQGRNGTNVGDDFSESGGYAVTPLDHIFPLEHRERL